MAQQVKILLTDDMDGSEATQTISFSLNEKSFEIDLNDDHADQLREALEPFMKAGRSSKGGRRANATRSGRAGSRNKEELAAIREWASKNGMEVAVRGRVSQKILDAYAEAHA